MKNTIKLIAVVLASVFIVSCAQPFSVTGPWGTVSQGEDKTIQIEYKPTDTK